MAEDQPFVFYRQSPGVCSLNRFGLEPTTPPPSEPERSQWQRAKEKNHETPPISSSIYSVEANSGHGCCGHQNGCALETYQQAASPASPSIRPWEVVSDRGWQSKENPDASQAQEAAPGFTEQQLCRQRSLDQLEERGRQYTGLYLEDGRTLNPMLAPFLDRGQKRERVETSWTWSVSLQRWYHYDKETNTRVFLPR